MVMDSSAISDLAKSIKLYSGKLFSDPWLFVGAEDGETFRFGKNGRSVYLSKADILNGVVDNIVSLDVGGKSRRFLVEV